MHTAFKMHSQNTLQVLLQAEILHGCMQIEGNTINAVFFCFNIEMHLEKVFEIIELDDLQKAGMPIWGTLGANSLLGYYFFSSLFIDILCTLTILNIKKQIKNKIQKNWWDDLIILPLATSLVYD